MPVTPLPLLIALAAPPWAWQAQAVHVHEGQVRVERPCLEGQGWRLQAAEAVGMQDDACQPRWHLTGPIEATGPDTRIEASRARACGARLSLDQPRLRSARLRLEARRLHWAEGTLEAEALTVSGCGCPDPPWYVTATHADWTPGGGVWATWPVLWLGGLPVATAPFGYVPTGDRRSGVLPPRLGFDGQDGLHGRLPLYWAPSDRFDLTLSPGWRQARGAEARGLLRWAQTVDDQGQLEARGIWTEGGTISGTGSAGWGPARLSLAGAASSSEPARQAQFRGLPERQRDHLAQSTMAVVAGADGELGGQLLTLQDLRAEGRPHTLWAQGWAAWRAPAAGGTVGLDLLTLERLDDTSAGPVADIALRAEHPFALGPLQLEPRLGAASVTHLGEAAGADQALVAWAALRAELAVQRALGTGHHAWRLQLDGRLAEASSRGIRAPLRPDDRPFSGRGTQARLESDLVGADWRFRVGGAVPYEAGVVGDEVAGLGPALVDLDLDLSAVSLLGGWGGPDAWWGSLQVRPADALTLRAGGAALHPDRQHPWRRSPLDQRPALLASDASPHRTLHGGLASRLGPVRLDGQVVVDAESALAYRGAWGSVAFEGRCQCWSVRLDASHEANRPWPDAAVALALTGL
ncbi:MAG: LPS-assembly protein LptD [Myxococcales bacterium]|nr:LPS-assembly protein LptD [Myxococcales bacterium]